MDDRIRERAYQIWLSEGKPLGRDADHWERARRQIEKELSDGAAAHKAGVNEVPAANITVHKGPDSSSPTPGLERADGINTPGVKARRS
jgi:Protein of unknown function (DUF2934).